MLRDTELQLLAEGPLGSKGLEPALEENSMATHRGRRNDGGVTSRSPKEALQGRRAHNRLGPGRGGRVQPPESSHGASSPSVAPALGQLSPSEGPERPAQSEHPCGRARRAAYHGLLHLHLNDVLVDVVPFILTRDAVVDVLAQVMLTAGGKRSGREAPGATTRPSLSASVSWSIKWAGPLPPMCL